MARRGVQPAQPQRIDTYPHARPEVNGAHVGPADRAPADEQSAVPTKEDNRSAGIDRSKSDPNSSFAASRPKHSTVGARSAVLMRAPRPTLVAQPGVSTSKVGCRGRKTPSRQHSTALEAFVGRARGRCSGVKDVTEAAPDVTAWLRGQTTEVVRPAQPPMPHTHPEAPPRSGRAHRRPAVDDREEGEQHR